MSHCQMPIVAANNAVHAPTTATTIIAVGASRYSAFDRTTMYTPAVTIVAAWMSADTGVGPAIASGNHTYSGICALLPHAPRNRRRQIDVSSHGSRLPFAAVIDTCAKSTLPM